jgi:transcription antitermination factor NusG
VICDEQIRLVEPIAWGMEAGFGRYLDDGWRLVKPLPNQDRRAAENLAVRSIPVYMAMAEYRTINNRGHVRRSVRPLFPSYIFAVGPVGDHYGPLGIASIEPISDPWQLCLDLHRLEAMRLADRPVLCPRTYSPGAQVLVTEGKYKGFVGTVERIKSRRMLAVWIDFMSRATLIDLDDFQVEPHDPMPTPSAMARAGC